MDRQPKTTIDINGRTYDARTGKIIGQTQPTVRPTNGAVLDGVRRHSTQAPQPVHAKAPQKPIPHKPKPTRTPGQTLDVRAVKKPQRSQTLLRSAVKKPQPAPKQPSSPVQMHAHDKARFDRAKQFTLSRSISRFGGHATPKPVLTKLSVAQAPESTPPNTAARTVASQQAPAPATQIQQNQIQHGRKHTKEEVFAHRIAAANTHLVRYDKKRSMRERLAKALRISPRLVSIGAACFAVVLIGGFFAYQRVPSIAMRVAANEAGFQGTIPKAVPAGYAFHGPIRAEKGSLTITYKSRNDGRSILVSQRPTEWTSESLLSNFIVDSKLRFQTYQDNGLTIYIYNEGSATWVDKGIWYNVTSQGSLSSQQILSLAASM